MKSEIKHGNDWKFLEGVRCPECNYFNQKEPLKRYGTCKLCGKVLDPKAKFEYEMYCKLHMWKKKPNNRRPSVDGRKEYSNL